MKMKINNAMLWLWYVLDDYGDDNDANNDEYNDDNNDDDDDLGSSF